jgi:hypothetical protein
MSDIVDRLKGAVNAYMLDAPSQTPVELKFWLGVTNLMNDSANEIIKLRENLAAKASEAEILALQAQNEKLLGDLKAIKKTLHRENDNKNSAIQDTIWHTDHQTLFDYIDASLGEHK